eukprot:2990882-Rhodomonas_salina.1
MACKECACCWAHFDLSLFPALSMDGAFTFIGLADGRRCQGGAHVLPGVLAGVRGARRKQLRAIGGVIHAVLR